MSPKVFLACKYLQAVVEAKGNTQLKYFSGDDAFDSQMFINANETQEFSEGIQRFNVRIRLLWGIYQLTMLDESALIKCVYSGVFSAPAEDLVKLLFPCFYENPRFKLLCDNNFNAIVSRNQTIIDYGNFYNFLFLMSKHLIRLMFLLGDSHLVRKWY